MADRPLSGLIRHLRRAALLQEEAALSDGQLLESFIARHDEAAFAALVRRHGPMVLGVCRRVLRNPHDAEDAFQATFLVLVRRAGSVVPRDRVGNFLYGTAYQTAMKARTAVARRRAREKQLPHLPEPATRPEPVPDWLPLLDQEVHRLPAKYRLPLVLCDVEGQTRKAAARQLGWPEGTLSGRLARARTMLARRLTRHGLAFSGGALAALAGATASACPSVALVGATLRASTLLAAGQPPAGALPPHVLALSERVVPVMLLTKLKIAGALVLLLGVLGFGTSLLHQALATAPSPTAPASPQAAGNADRAKAPAAPRPAPPRDNEAKIWTLDFLFKDPRWIVVNDPVLGKKTILYLRYEVVNATGEPHVFIPDFELQAGDKRARDQVLPRAVKHIADVEDPTHLLDLKNSVTIGGEPIRKKATGIATWDEVDPKCQRCRLYVAGLSNTWSVDEPVLPATQPVVFRKTLQLDFKREAGTMVFVPPARWVYRPTLLPPPDRKEPPKANPPEPQALPDDPLQAVRARRAIADQQADALVEDAIGRANRLFQTTADDAREHLQRTLESVRNNPDLSIHVGTVLGRRLEAALQDVTRRRARPEGRGGDKDSGGLASESMAQRQIRLALIAGLEQELAPLVKQESERQTALELGNLRLQALRKAIEETKPTGIEADRAQERLRQLEIYVDHLRTEKRDEQIYFQLLERRLQKLKQAPASELPGP